MEKLMLGTKIKNTETFSSKNKSCECFALVRKGHEECGDSAFVYMDEKKTIIGVFDGVSGEAGAASASSEAATALLKYLKKYNKADEKLIKKAMVDANNKVKHGYTTAALCFVEKDGSTIVAGIGDSPIYGIDKKGEVALELPLGRAVKDNDSILKFFHFRALVTSVLGPSGTEIHINMRKGKLKKGEMLILATDGLTDNLHLKIHEGYVKDSSGSQDLKKLIGKSKKPETIGRNLFNEVKKRIKGKKIETKNSILIPKEDDIAIAVFKKL